MQFLPEKFEQLELKTEEKAFLRILDRSLRDEDSYYVLHINPRRAVGRDGNAAELLNLLVVKKGVLLFQFFDLVDLNIVVRTLDVLKKYLFHTMEKDLQDRLKQSRYLTDEKDELKIECKLKFVFAKVSQAGLLSYGLDEDLKQFIRKTCIFEEDLQQLKRNGKEYIDSLLDGSKEIITEDIINNIFQRLCPEITIPRKIILDEYQHVDGVDGCLTTVDRSVQSYRLEPEQINLVNRIAKGNQLILACAGSGKSVILISKCFKLASLNPKEKFLITCYNRNLSDYYQWAIAQASFRDKNVVASSFFSLCIDLLQKNNIPVPSNGDYDEIFRTANSALKGGRIKQRFYGIFIDEIQVFKPQWYQFCFNLLKSKNDDDHFFCIAGDKSQDIKANIKQGKAPWQGAGEGYPKYVGRTIPIEINYRNSIQINEAIDKFVNIAKDVGAKYGIDFASDPELFLRGKAYREGNKPVLRSIKHFSNSGESQAIIDAIKYLMEVKGYSDIDIAVIFYNTKGYAIKPWREGHYTLLPEVKSYLFKENIDFTVLIKSESKTTYGARRGITITTIESSLGLDFKGVILAGLRPLGVHEGIRTESDLKNMSQLSLELQQQKQDGFRQNVNFVYTGCTRAKDDLVVILSGKEGESIYQDMLRKAFGG